MVLAGEAGLASASRVVGEQEVVFGGNDLAFTNALGTLAHLWTALSRTWRMGFDVPAIRLRTVTLPGAVLQALSERSSSSNLSRFGLTMESLFIQAVQSEASPAELRAS